MYLYKRNDSPYWWMGFTANGKTVKKSTQRLLADEAGANRVLAQEYTKAMDAAQFGVLPEITLGEAMALTVKTVSGSTQRSYDLSRRKWIGLAPFNTADHWSLSGEMNVSAVPQNSMARHKAERQGEGLKANSINIEVRFFQRMYNLCRDEWGYHVEPLKFQKLPSFEKTRYLSDEEEAAVTKALLEGGGTSYLKALDFFILLIDTGMRLGEALELTWKNCNFPKRHFEVFSFKTGALGRVPMSDRVFDMLQRRRNYAKPFEEMTRSVKLLRTAIDAACNTDERVVQTRGAATIHSLRDTFATRLGSRGMTLHGVSKLLRHSNTTMTRKYAHVEQDGLVEDARKLLNG